MSGAPDPDRGALAFAEKLMTVLAEGSFTGTYKYGVMLALIDLCLERPTTSGAAPASIAVEQLAEKVIELYWRHALPYPAPHPEVLKQNTTGQMELVTRIREFRERYSGDETGSLSRARMQAPVAYGRLVRDVEWKLAEMPLPRLQSVGHAHDEFIYRIAWNREIKRSQYFALGRERSLHLAREAGDHLVRLAGLLRPMIQREWVRFIADLNRQIFPEADLEEFLFGVARGSLGPVRKPLHDLHEGRCFYCGGQLRDGWEIDHFVPWSRHPDDGIENLVAADRGCNGAKRAHLAANDHVERWLARTGEKKLALGQIANDLRWDQHPDRTTAVARSIYLRLPAATKLWRDKKEFEAIDRPRLLRAFDHWA